MIIKRASLLIVSFVFLISAVMPLHTSASASKGRMIENSIFDNKNSMSAAQIDAFLNTFPSSCISPNSGFAANQPTGYNSTNGFSYGSVVSAGTVIFSAAQAYDINPQVLLTKLQNEQGLVRGDGSLGCGAVAMASAMGYACSDGSENSLHTYSYPAQLLTPLFYRNGTPTNQVGNGPGTGTCVSSGKLAGFSEQVINGAWLLKHDRLRSEGIINSDLYNKPGWDNSDDDDMYYGGPMTQGYRKRSQASALTYFDGYLVIDGHGFLVENGATAALYHYTPHIQSFSTIFQGLGFGNPVSSCNAAGNFTTMGTGARVVRDRINSNPVEALALTFINQTGSACTETHVWRTGQQSWISNIASNHRVLSPADNTIISAKVVGDFRSDITLVKYRNSTSGKIEIHNWDATNQQWAGNFATNHPAVSPANAKVIAADTNGDGVDELHLIKLNGGASGRIEIHTWLPGYQGWYSNIATNHPAVLTSNATVIAGDTNGDGKDELMLVKYRNNGSGRIEIHTWLPGYQGWYSNIATNHPAVAPPDNEVIAADTDGIGIDKLKLIKYKGGASGKIEVHTWLPGYQGWYSNVATNHPAVTP